MQLTLVLNKIDRLILEVQITPEQAYERIRAIITHVNTIVSAFQSEKYISEADVILASQDVSTQADARWTPLSQASFVFHFRISNVRLYTTITCLFSLNIKTSRHESHGMPVFDICVSKPAWSAPRGITISMTVNVVTRVLSSILQSLFCSLKDLHFCYEALVIVWSSAF